MTASEDVLKNVNWISAYLLVAAALAAALGNGASSKSKSSEEGKLHCCGGCG